MLDTETGSVIYRADIERVLESPAGAGVIGISPDGATFIYRSADNPQAVVTIVDLESMSEIESRISEIINSYMKDD